MYLRVEIRIVWSDELCAAQEAKESGATCCPHNQILPFVWLGESEPLILPINVAVMGNWTCVGCFTELISLMPLMIRLMHGEWSNGAMHAGFAWILKYLRPAR